MRIRSILLAPMLFFGVSASAHAVQQTKSDEFCLALTAFTEARAEGEHGMALVVHTVLNRAKTRKTTVCNIAYAPSQFHGVLNWPKGRNPSAKNPDAWAAAVRVVNRVYAGAYDFGSCTGAQYFYAPKVVRRPPGWSSRLPYLCQYRGHRFYGVA